VISLIGAAVHTPLGDLSATIAAIAEGRRAGERDAATGLVVARLSGNPTGDRHTRLVGVLSAFALDVARTAVARTATLGVPPGTRTGVFAATGGLRAQWDELAPAMAGQAADATNAWARGLSRMHPLWMLRYLSNAAHAIIAAELSAHGDGATFAGPAAAASALVAAHAAFDAGTIDHAIVIALDDVTADEVAVELAARVPGRIPGMGVAALVLARRCDDEGEDQGEDRASGVELIAVDGVDPEHAEPSPAAVAALRSLLPRAERDVAFSSATGWLGAASLLTDAIIAAELMRTGWPPKLDLGRPRSVTITAAESPGQIGIVRVEVTR
jgi:hypothetical protein